MSTLSASKKGQQVLGVERAHTKYEDLLNNDEVLGNESQADPLTTFQDNSCRLG